MDTLDREHLRYTEDDLWAHHGPDGVRIGITDFAQDQLGAIVYVDFPAVGVRVERGQTMGEVESTKTVADLVAPISGTVVARNDGLEADPAGLNESPHGAGWLVIVDPEEPAELQDLLTAAEYWPTRQQD